MAGQEVPRTNTRRHQVQVLPCFSRLRCGRFGFGFICGAVTAICVICISSQIRIVGSEWNALRWVRSSPKFYSSEPLGGEKKEKTEGQVDMAFDTLELHGKFFADHIVVSRDAWESVDMWGAGAKQFCPDVDAAVANATKNPLPNGETRRVLMNITFDSEVLFQNAGYGQGNWITALYELRLQALQLGVDMMLTCFDAEKNKANHILPWLNGYFPARDEKQPFPWPHSPPPKRPSKLLDSCATYELSEMTPFIRYELRRMAIALVGIPYKGHPSEAWAEEHLWSESRLAADIMQLPDPKEGEPPIVPNIEVDDTAIHFRCEDLMASNHPAFGFMKFTAYTKRIYPNTKSIGIVTNPFDDKAQNRGGAGRRPAARDACMNVTFALSDFLAEKFPQARITIRNGLNETVATAFARLVMANQTIVGISSFGIWTAMANFGQGFIRKPDYRKAPNEWCHPLAEMYDDITLFEEPKRLPASKAKQLKSGNMTKMLNWFMNDSIDID